MGMRCELFGHDFGDSKIEESYDEDERGTVLTVREYRSCQRCGHIRSISENQGVISTVAESKATDGQSDTAEYSAETRQPVDQRETVADETESTDTGQAPAETDTADTPESAATASDTMVDSASDTEVNNESLTVASSTLSEGTDDAMILSESEPQEPDAASTAPLDSDDAVIIDDATDTADPSSEPSGSGSRNDRGGSPPTVDDGEHTTSDSDPTYQCPRCEFELPASESTFFAGDVCPQCRVGYLTDTLDSEP